MKRLMRITRYGLSPRVNGWDKPGDDGTDNWQGDAGNKINLSTCAPSKGARQALGIGPKDFALLRITFAEDPRWVFYRVTGDEAPENDDRVDLFFPWSDQPYIPDHGFVEVITNFGPKEFAS